MCCLPLCLSAVLTFLLLNPVGWSCPHQLNAQEEVASSIDSIRATARVTVSDGLVFEVDTFYRDPQRAIFKQTYSDQIVTNGIDGRYYWQYEDRGDEEGGEIEGSEFVRFFVMGHQFHAQLLFFEQINAPIVSTIDTMIDDLPCRATLGENGCQLSVCAETGRAIEFRIVRPDESDIVAKFEDWRTVGEVSLPFQVIIDDGERTFEYEYQSVEFNQGDIDEYRCPTVRLTDEQQLLRSHRLLMDAHLNESLQGLVDYFGDNVVFVNNGDVEEKSAAETRMGLSQIFSNRDYTLYDDLIRPRVTVSDDGTLGWVIVKIKAKGIRLDESGTATGPLEFVCAWISTYEKQGGQWKMIGNASNFEPEH